MYNNDFTHRRQYHLLAPTSPRTEQHCPMRAMRCLRLPTSLGMSLGRALLWSWFWSAGGRRRSPLESGWTLSVNRSINRATKTTKQQQKKTHCGGGGGGGGGCWACFQSPPARLWSRCWWNSSDCGCRGKTWRVSTWIVDCGVRSFAFKHIMEHRKQVTTTKFRFQHTSNT